MDAETRSRFDLALIKNSIADVRVMVKHGVDVNESHSETKRSPLMVAARCLDVDAVRYFLELGAYVNREDRSGHVALNYLLQGSEFGFMSQEKYEKKFLDILSDILKSKPDLSIESKLWHLSVAKMFQVNHSNLPDNVNKKANQLINSYLDGQKLDGMIDADIEQANEFGF